MISNFIQKMRVSGLLSFAPGAPAFDLGPLTVIIGANASGKSNLIEALRLLRAAPSGIVAAIQAGGGMDELLWHGDPPATRAEIEVEVACGHWCGFRISAEQLGPTARNWDSPEFAGRGRQFMQMRIFGAQALMPPLGTVERLNDGAFKQQIVERLRDASDGYEDIEVRTEGGLPRLFVRDRGKLCPLHRLSAGTIHWLGLLMILLDPEPAPLVAIDQPELRLHPDLLPGVRDLLLAASKRGQVIVTTHSPMLLDCFSEHLECIRVCENDGTGTRLFPIPPALQDRLRDTGSLAQLWAGGEIGGTRW